MNDELILEKLKSSRKLLKNGDVFVLKPKGKPYYFGRVINTKTQIGGFEDVILCYIYDASSADKNEIPDISKDKLLIPPFGIDRSPWSSGVFEVVGSIHLTDEDMLPVHVFKSPLSNTFYDEYGNEISSPSEIFAYNSVTSDITIDYQVGKALGLIHD